MLDRVSKGALAEEDLRAVRAKLAVGVQKLAIAPHRKCASGAISAHSSRHRRGRVVELRLKPHVGLVCEELTSKEPPKLQKHAF
jgi:hypothetical protein